MNFDSEFEESDQNEEEEEEGKGVLFARGKRKAFGLGESEKILLSNLPSNADGFRVFTDLYVHRLGSFDEDQMVFCFGFVF